MELDGGTITAVGGATVAVLGTFGAAIGKVWSDLRNDTKEARDETREARKHSLECLEEHAETREKLAGLLEAVRIQSNHQPREVRERVNEAIESAENRAVEARVTVKQQSILNNRTT